MRTQLVLVLFVVACGTDLPTAESTTPTGTSAIAHPAPPPASVAAAPAAPRPAEPVADPPPAESPVAPGGHDFTPEGRALLAVGACGAGSAPATVTAKQLAAHCARVEKVRDEYASRWITRARPFFAEKVPANVPKKVVYPFAGGDLSTALTVFPDADEITTISLEPAGDPRTINVLTGKDLDRALAKIQYELRFLYRVNFSNTLNMIEAMRGGALPTQLVFGLSALELHGFELVALRYFTLAEDGAIRYLDDATIAAAPDPAKRGTAEKRNRVFGNAEVQFRRPGGRIQVWRHLRQNLGNATSKRIGAGLQTDARIVRHLEAKGPIAGMTKAASYLLSWDSFSIMRDYLVENVVWMVSDATGVAPKWASRPGSSTRRTVRSSLRTSVRARRSRRTGARSSPRSLGASCRSGSATTTRSSRTTSSSCGARADAL